MLSVVGFYQRRVPLFLYGFQCCFYLKDLPIGYIVSCYSYVRDEFSMDYRHYSIKNILVAHGDKDTEMELESLQDNGVGGLQ